MRGSLRGRAQFCTVLVRLHAVLALGLLSACGGGTSSPTPNPAANHPPAFTSAASTNVTENASGVVYQAAASDADGDALTYSIAGGEDAAFFSISPSGQVSFTAPPNFDLISDANGDNVYQVQIAVSDGKATTALALAVTVTNSKEGVDVRRVATGFVAPVTMSPVSGTAILVAERAGSIYLLNPQTGAKSLLVQIPSLGSSGVVAIAAASSFASDGAFYAMYTTANGFIVINRYLRNPSGTTVADNTGPVLSVNAPQYGGGGWLGLDNNGVLLAATGDAGGSGDPTGSAQNSASWLGKLIRIAPDPDPYAGVTPNFFILTVIAKGLHQPNGASVFQGNVLIADHGQDTVEEIDLLPSGSGLRNFGWPFKEGTRTVSGTPPSDVIDSAVEYLRGNGPKSGAAIVGGTRGPGTVASLKDQYLFADGSGAIFAVNFASVRDGTTLTATAMERRDADFAPDRGTIDHPVAIVADRSGVPYILDADGEIFVVGGS